MKPVDFKAKFAEYLKAWAEKYNDGMDDEDLDEVLPAIYADWINEKADWLGGKSPDEYFRAFDANELISALRDYIESDTDMPNQLLDEAAVRCPSEMLYAIALDENESAHMRAHALSLLEEKDDSFDADVKPLLGIIAESENGDEFTEAIIDMLYQDESAVDEMLRLMEDGVTDYAYRAFMSLLCEFPGNRQTARYLNESILAGEDIAFYASLAGKFGSYSFVKTLREIARNPELDMFDYIAVRDAIEALGGTAPGRTFTREEQEAYNLKLDEAELLAEKGEHEHGDAE